MRKSLMNRLWTPVMGALLFTAILALPDQAIVMAVQSPVWITCPDSVHVFVQGTVATGQVEAAISISYSVVSGPLDLVINDTTGEWSWPTTPSDIGLHSIDFAACDTLGFCDTCNQRVVILSSDTVAFFIGHFMTTEGDPYPFDVTVSNGEWVQEFDDVTYLATEVPDSSTFTYVWEWPPSRTMTEWDWPFTPGEVSELIVYAIDRTYVQPRVRPYLLVKDINANESLSWNWDPLDNTLTWNGTTESGTSIGIGVWIDDNLLLHPDYVLDLCTSSDQSSETCWLPPNVMWNREFGLASEGLLGFKEIELIEEVLAIRRALYNGAIIDTFSTGFQSRLLDSSGVWRTPEFLYPQYALVEGNYIIQPLNLPEDYMELAFPVTVSLGIPQIVDIYPPRRTEIKTFTFAILAESFYANSFYSNVVYNNDSLSVDVHTEIDRDWWGCFILPEKVGVRQLVAYPDTGGAIELKHEIDWLENCDTDYNLIAVRINSSIIRLNLVYKQNEPPVIDCGSGQEYVVMGNTLVKSDIVGTDADACDVLTYYIADVTPNPVGMCSIDPNTGVVTFDTDDPCDGGILYTFEVCGKDSLYATCCDFQVDVLTLEPWQIYIERIHNVLQGHFTDIAVTVSGSDLEMGGFDFLIAYDASALAFTEAKTGQLLEDCGWEYFTYRYGFQGNCGDACPSGLLRIIAIAETNNGPYHPSCYGPPDMYPHELAELTFFVTNDRTYDCQYAPVYFFWDDCSDNAISSISGDTLFIDNAIYDHEGNLIWDEMDEEQFPESSRIPFVGAPDYCLNPDPDKPSAIRFIEFVNGGFDIICSDSIDLRGDINCNGIAYEIADATMLANYFIRGLAAFNGHKEASIAASDTNNDGIPLTIADLVYLIRVITGDAEAYPKPLTSPTETIVSANINHSAAAISIQSQTNLGGAYFELTHSGYEIGEPHLIGGASDMTLRYRDENGLLKVVVYSMEKDKKIPAGSEHIFAFPIAGEGTIALKAVQLSDYFGHLIEARIEPESVLPEKYELHQNYPNPFNSGTTIFYELPRASQVRIEVFNVLGQKVATLLDQPEEAGIHSVQWNGTDQSGHSVSSGIYAYRITTQAFTDERKMVLMK